MLLGIIKSGVNAVLTVTGLGKITAQWSDKPWLTIVLLVCVVMTHVWMIRLTPRVTAGVAKQIGGLVYAIIKIAVGIGVAISLVHWIVGLGLGMITGGLHQFAHTLENTWWLPLIGDLLGGIIDVIADGIDLAVSLLVGLVVSVMLGWHIIKNIPSIYSQLMGTIKAGAGDWQANEGEGLLRVKWSHVLPITCLVSGFICHPAWNADYWCAPALLSATLGVVALFKTTKRGQDFVDHAKAKVLGQPLENGDWFCPNPASHENPMPLLDRNLKPVLNARGKVKGIATGICGHKNRKKDRICGSLICGEYPNPYSQVCEACGFAGEDKQGYRRAPPDRPDVCPECQHVHPPLPKWTKFHLPGKGKKVVKKAAPKPQAAAQPQAAQPAPAPQQDRGDLLLGNEHLQMSRCASCKGDMGFVLDEKHCPYCGASLTGEVSPSGPMAAQPEPEEEEGVVKKDYDVLDDKS